ncbi:hypothetical protein CK203_037882 [Vitis vinifera]|uniref:Methyltransferase domain-containing protein n=1 Tax=Vitis vinifera TaxID=29760 RepID=A0A438IC76_VITVI|nr:hypothetical protein CK203_037882 [Vitis vinifera]
MKIFLKDDNLEAIEEASKAKSPSIDPKCNPCFTTSAKDLEPPGYLAQVLSFQYQLSVVAIDSCSHHGNVTNARAERIKKHYAAQMRKSGSGSRSLNVPKTVTCRVMSADMLKAVNDMLLSEDDVQCPQQIGQSISQPSHPGLDKRRLPSLCDVHNESSFVLAGLHACGDLSVTMLR